MKRIFFGLLIISVISFFNSCQNNVDSEDSYTVWTDLSTYSEFQSTFGTTLDDGMYVRLEFTSSQWSQMSGSLTNEGRHSWTKLIFQIKLHALVLEPLEIVVKLHH